MKHTESVVDKLQSKFGANICIGSDCDLAPDIFVEIDEGGFLALGDRVSIRRCTTIQVHRNATIIIGNDVAIGENTFLSAMVGIRIGDGVGISNMVDFHDHNHRERTYADSSSSKITPWASGFSGAPIIIQSGAVISNKVSVTAGIRVGQNSIIGANSVVTRSLGPNTVAVGNPARPIRKFDAAIADCDDRQTLRVAWFGTSIMEHLEGYNAQMVNQANLPKIGSSVTVESWRNRGYVQRLQLALQVEWPFLQVTFDNRGEGGATSRDIVRTVRQFVEADTETIDLAFVGCGVNDVWRGFQGRMTEAVEPNEFTANCTEMLNYLINKARRVICVGECPMGWDSKLDTNQMNSRLAQYNELAARIAADAKVPFVNVWPAFVATAQELSASSGSIHADRTLWSDGVHLSELGDALMFRLIDQKLRDMNVIAELTRYDLYERDKACAVYRHLFSPFRR